MNFTNLPPELVLQNILTLQLDDIKNICQSNKYVNKICKENNEYIWNSLIKRDFPWIDFKNPKTLYLLFQEMKFQRVRYFNKDKHYNILRQILLTYHQEKRDLQNNNDDNFDDIFKNMTYSIEIYLKLGVSINSLNRDNENILFEIQDDTNVLKYLISKNINLNQINVEEYNFLHFSIANNYSYDFIDILLQNKINNNILFYILDYNRQDLLPLIKKYKYNINSTSFSQDLTNYLSNLYKLFNNKINIVIFTRKKNILDLYLKDFKPNLTQKDNELIYKISHNYEYHKLLEDINKKLYEFSTTNDKTQKIKIAIDILNILIICINKYKDIMEPSVISSGTHLKNEIISNLHLIPDGHPDYNYILFELEKIKKIPEFN